jgi:hypothetical protein
MIQNTTPVSEHLRRANSRAVQERARWRKQYADLVQEIKQTKQRRREDPQNRSHEVNLNALRIHAQIMMIDRNMLTQDLQMTAYRWVDVNEEAPHGI